MNVKTLLFSSMLFSIFANMAYAMNEDECLGAASKYNDVENICSIEDLYEAEWDPMRFDCYSLLQDDTTTGQYVMSIESIRSKDSRKDFFASILYANTPFICSIPSLVEVVLPLTVTKIGDSAFEGTAIRQLTMPLSVKEIGEHIFKDCKNICFVVLPEKLVETYQGTQIVADRLELPLGKLIFMTNQPTVTDEISAGDGKFYNKDEISSSDLKLEKRREMGLPKGLILSQNQNGNYDITEIENDWIELQKNDEEGFIGGKVFMEGEPFKGSKKNILNLLIAGIKEKSHFMNVSPIDTLPQTLKKIGDRAFQNTIIQQLTIPFGVTDMGDKVFKGCKCLTQLAVSTGLVDKYGGLKAFADKVGLPESSIIYMTKVPSYEVKKFQEYFAEENLLFQWLCHSGR